VSEDELHFDDHGAPCEWVAPVYPEEPESLPIREAAVSRLLDFLCAGQEAEDVGRRAILLTYICRTPYGPRTQRELAMRLGLSLGQTNTILGRLRLAMSEISHSESEQSPDPWNE
jgi:hypothetical protein